MSLSLAEGRNKFRSRWTQAPLYSGGPIAALRADVVHPGRHGGASGSGHESSVVSLVACANGDTLNLTDAEGASLLATRQTVLGGDVILQVTTTASLSTAAKLSSSVVVSPGGHPMTGRQTLGYVALSTRALQVAVLEVAATVTPASERPAASPASPSRKKRKSTRDGGEEPAGESVASSSTQLSAGLSIAQDAFVCSFQLITIKSWTADHHAIGCLAFARLGASHLAVGATDGGLKVWDVFHHHLTHRFVGAGGVVTSLCFEERDRLLCAGTFEGTMSLIDFQRKKVLATAKPYNAPIDAISFLTVAPVPIVEDVTGESVAEALDAVLGCFEIAVATRDRRLTVYSAKNLVELRAVVVPDPVCSAVFVNSRNVLLGCQNGNLLLAGFFADQRIVVRGRLGKRTTTTISTEDNDERCVKAIAVLPAVAPRRLIAPAAAAHRDANVVEEDDEAPSTAASKDSKKLKKSKRKLSSRSGDVDAEPTTATAPQVAPDDPSSIGDSTDVTFDVIVATGALSFVTCHGVTPTAGADRIAIAPTRTVVACLDQVLDVVLLDRLLADGNVGIPNDPTPPAARRDVRRLLPRLVVSNSTIVHLFQGPMGSAAAVRQLVGHTDVVLTASVSPDAALIVTAGKDRTVRCWSTSSGRCVAIGTLPGTAEEHLGCSALGWQSGSQQAAFAFVGSNSGALLCWDLTKAAAAVSGEPTDSPGVIAKGSDVPPSELALLHRMDAAHDGPVHTTALSTSGLLAASGGKDKNVMLWELKGKGRLSRMATLKGHRRAVNKVVFSPIDKVVASASSDATVRLWSVTSMSCVKCLQPPDKTALHQVAFFNSGLQLVTGNAEGLLRFWAVAAGEIVAAQPTHDDKVFALAVKEFAAAPTSAAAVGEAAASKLADIVFLSGAADGTIVCTDDITANEVARQLSERASLLEAQQTLANALRHGKFAAAFELALTLNHPRYLRNVITAWMTATAEPPKAKADADDDLSAPMAPLTACDREMLVVIQRLGEADLARLLDFTREWSTNARFAMVASQVIGCCLRAFSATALSDMPCVQQVVEALVAYGRRHADRCAKFEEQLHFINYLLHRTAAASSAAA